MLVEAALGVMLTSQGIAQISMNLLDYRRTSPRVVMDRVDAESAQRGLRVTHYELVGCAPEDALDDAARARIPELQPSQLLDARWF